MPFNGSGVFQRVRNWVADATAGVKIRADYHDAEDDGFAAGLSNTITKDGQTTITQNIPFNSKRITGLADPINAQDASTKAYTDTKLPAAGGSVMTGDLIVKKDNPAIILNSTAGSSSVITGQEGDKSRWSIFLGDNAPETGGNVGSDFDILSYDDAGNPLAYPLVFKRSTSLGKVAGNPTDPLGIVTKQYADAGDATAAASANSRVMRAGDTMTGQLTLAESGMIAQGGSAPSMQVYTAGGNACIGFHCAGSFGANFGMANDGNFYMGGWSHGAAAYKFWTTRDFTALPTAPVAVTNARLATNTDYLVTATGTVNEPLNGGVLTGLGAPFNGGTMITMRIKQLQIQINGAWGVVGYA